LEHPVLGLSFRAEDGINLCSADRITAGREGLAKGLRLFRLRAADFLHLVQRGLYASREFVGFAFATDVHEIDLRLVVEEVVVQRRDAHARVEQGAHHRVHFVLHEHEIAHDHRGRFLSLGERRPRCEPHEWRHLPAIDVHLHVATRRGNFEHTLGFAERPFEAGQLFDFCAVDRGIGDETRNEE
jgi:hypothetical protein